LATYEINLNNVLSFQFSIIKKILTACICYRIFSILRYMLASLIDALIRLVIVDSMHMLTRRAHFYFHSSYIRESSIL
jgi:hypothetical protein